MAASRDGAENRSTITDARERETAAPGPRVKASVWLLSRLPLSWAGERWHALRSVLRRGAVLGAVVAVVLNAIYLGRILRLGYGPTVDTLLALGGSALLGAPIVVFVAATLAAVRQLNGLAAGAVLAAVLLLMAAGGVGPPFPMAPISVVLVVATCTALLAATRRTQRTLGIRTALWALVAVATAAIVAFVSFLRGDGEADLRASRPATAPTGAPAFPAVDPSTRGPFAVRTLHYGSGKNRRRPEYGAGVPLVTRTVDATPWLPGYSGLSRAAHRTYWGFDADEYPLDAIVWYPAGDGPFPLVLAVHGLHAMEEPSEQGYAYLGEQLASRGFIVASVDENFLNGSWAGGVEDDMETRAWLLLEHLREWRAWNETPGNVFFGKVEMKKIGLLGHSRGGEAVAAAAYLNTLACAPEDCNQRFDYRFSIKAVGAFAPVDERYRPGGLQHGLRDVSYLVLQGDYDADVPSFVGTRQYDRTSFSEGYSGFKAEVFIGGANHSQFNTVWGSSDLYGPVGWLLNRKPLLAASDQRQIASVFVPAFLEATLHDRREYVPIFHDPRSAGAWLPSTEYRGRYEDASFVRIADFGEDADPTTTTRPGGLLHAEHLCVWREQRIPLRDAGFDRDHRGAYLGWNGTGASYAISLPPDVKPPPTARFVLSLAAADEDAPGPAGNAGAAIVHDRSRAAPDLTIEMETSDGRVRGQPLSRFGRLAPPFRGKVWKSDTDDVGKPADAVLENVEVPLAAFGSAPDFDPAKLTTVRLRFDRTPAGVIVVGGIGFAE